MTYNTIDHKGVLINQNTKSSIKSKSQCHLNLTHIVIKQMTANCHEVNVNESKYMYSKEEAVKKKLILNAIHPAPLRYYKGIKRGCLVHGEYWFKFSKHYRYTFLPSTLLFLQSTLATSNGAGH